MLDPLELRFRMDLEPRIAATRRPWPGLPIRIMHSRRRQSPSPLSAGDGWRLRLPNLPSAALRRDKVWDKHCCKTVLVLGAVWRATYLVSICQAPSATFARQLQQSCPIHVATAGANFIFMVLLGQGNKPERRVLCRLAHLDGNSRILYANLMAGAGIRDSHPLGPIPNHSKDSW